MTVETVNHLLVRRLSLLVSALLFSACRSPTPEPAPPPASYELAIGAPHARGARAAGTDAAPPPPREGSLDEPSTEEEDENEPAADAGADADGGFAADAGAGVAL